MMVARAAHSLVISPSKREQVVDIVIGSTSPVMSNKKNQTRSSDVDTTKTSDEESQWKRWRRLTPTSFTTRPTCESNFSKASKARRASVV